MFLNTRLGSLVTRELKWIEREINYFFSQFPYHQIILIVSFDRMPSMQCRYQEASFAAKVGTVALPLLTGRLAAWIFGDTDVRNKIGIDPWSGLATGGGTTCSLYGIAQRRFEDHAARSRLGFREGKRIRAILGAPLVLIHEQGGGGWRPPAASAFRIRNGSLAL